MSRKLRDFQLRRRDPIGLVDCSLSADLAELELLAVDAQWHVDRSAVVARLIEAKAPRSDWPQSWHWDWTRKLLAANTLIHAVYAIECAEGCLGVMLLRLDPRYRAKLEPEAGQELVYVDFVEIAPRNWSVPALGQQPRFKGIGTALLLAAVERSMEEEFGGKVGLHALPQSEKFYEALGMTRVGPDPLTQGLAYFELTRAQAQEVWKKGGWT